MSNFLPAALAGLVTGTIAAVVVVAISSPTDGSVQPLGDGSASAASPASLGGEVAALRSEYTRLRSDLEVHQVGVNQRLDEVLSQMSRVSVASRESNDDSTAVAASIVAEELAASGALLAADPQFETAVAAAIQRIEDREREEQAAARRQRELDQIEERLAGMRTALSLSGYQETQMRTVMIDNLDKANALRDSMRNDTLSRDEMRDAFTGLRDGFNSALSGILSTSQYEQYQAEFANRFGGGFGDRGDRGNRGGGPGGGAPGAQFGGF